MRPEEIATGKIYANEDESEKYTVLRLYRDGRVRINEPIWPVMSLRRFAAWAHHECQMIEVIPDMPFADYLERPGLSSSFLRAFLRSPAHTQVPKPDTPAMLVGRGIHCLTLEGEDVFLSRFAVAPECDKRTKDGKAAWSSFVAQNAGLEIIDLEQRDTIYACAEALARHEIAGPLISGGVHEVSVFWTLEGIPCKARYDIIGEDYEGAAYIADIKKTQDAGPWGFGRAVRYTYRYDIQAAFYTLCPDAPQRFYFLAVEERPPFGVAVYRASRETIEDARREIYGALPQIRECLETGIFPGYEPIINEI